MKLEEAIQLDEAKIKKLLLLDIDDTIVKAKGIYIYKKLNGKEFPLTPDEFAKEKVTSENSYMYDFREFENPKIVANSIYEGEPILFVLQYMDHMIGKGYKVGILTARGMESVINNTIQNWLKYKKSNRLKNIGGKLKEVFAINDKEERYEGSTSFERKANVIKNLAQKYHKIIFVDDDAKNIEAVDELNLRGVKVKNILDIKIS